MIEESDDKTLLMLNYRQIDVNQAITRDQKWKETIKQWGKIFG